MKVKTFGKTLGVALGVLTVVALVGAPAAADPISPPAGEGATADWREINGSGSDTTQDVMNGLANVITDPGLPNNPPDQTNKYFASWNPLPAESITVAPDADGAGPRSCTLTRPNGSGAGRTALVNAENPAHATF